MLCSVTPMMKQGKIRYQSRSAMCRNLLIILLICVLVTGIAATQTDRIDRNELKTELDALLRHDALHGAQVSLGFYSLEGNRAVYEHNSSRNMIPASVQKLFTTVAAIRRFGWDYRFRTRIGYRGKIKDSVLIGNLVIIADGDPSWAESIYPEGGHLVFEQWADALLAHGINRIKGKLIINTGKFAFQKRGDGWEKDDEPYGYAAPISPFSFNENAIGFDLVAPDTLGVPVNITTRHGYSYLTVENRLITTPANTTRNIKIRFTDDRHQRLIYGTMPMGTQRTVRASVGDPVDFGVSVLRNAFIRKGITLSGRYCEDRAKPNKVEMIHLFDYESVELVHIIRYLLKDSSNMISEMLLHQFGKGTKAGTGYIKQTLKEIGIDPGAMSVADGSGLSRKNQVGAWQIRQLLAWCHSQPWFEQFYNALAVNGIDGTMKNRLNDEDIRGRIHAKTGSLTGVNTIAGYVRAADDRQYVFVIMCRGYKSGSAVMNWQDDVCRLFIRYDDSLDESKK